jgi:N-acetylmuramoyl-L-alanine amidase
MPSFGRSLRVLTAAAAVWLAVSAEVSAQTAKERYESVVSRDSQLRPALQNAGKDSPPTELLGQAAQVIASYEALVRRFPTSGYADNALWQAATLADATYQKSSRSADLDRSQRLYKWLVLEYPSSAFVLRAKAQMARLDVRSATREAAPIAPLPATAVLTKALPIATAPIIAVAAPIAPARILPDLPAAAPPAPVAEKPTAARATLAAIQRTILPDSVRVTLELDREVVYREERLGGPARVFFDLKSVQLPPALMDKVLSYPEDVVNKIRVGRHPDNTVRVVIDLENVSRYSVFTLYNPFRLVIDCERTEPRKVTQPTVVPPSAVEPTPAPNRSTQAPAIELSDPVPLPPTPPAPIAPSPVAPAPLPATPGPGAAQANTFGGFSIARQLGLGISRIVIDPGHGGHDPGAHGKGLNESDLTLDVALRLEKLLQKEAGLEVTLTRRTDVYIPLEERTAIANRQSADLFLSIHANASRIETARGVETYILSFASSPDAEAVAARENSSSEREMHHLPDIIKAIALNNKLDESKDLAAMVQNAMVTNLRKNNKAVRDLGVKKAPFVVLIGAGMPSVLAEIAFLTNKQELQFLKTPAYKQRIADALAAAVLRYRRSLKGANAVASQ